MTEENRSPFGMYLGKAIEVGKLEERFLEKKMDQEDLVVIAEIAVSCLVKGLIIFVLFSILRFIIPVPFLLGVFGVLGTIMYALVCFIDYAESGAIAFLDNTTGFAWLCLCVYASYVLYS